MIEHFLIKEGINQIIIALIVTILLSFFVCDFLALVSLVISIGLFYIYRVPFRTHNIVKGVVAPIDGKVLAIDNKNNQSILYVDLGLCNTHVIVAPENGEYELLEYKKGLNLDSDSFKAKKLNSNIKLKFESLLMELTPGRFNTLLSIAESKEVHQHDKIGAMVEGTIKITFNSNITPKVKLGQKIYAGETIIA